MKTGTTLLTDGHRSYPGLTDYRHDPRTVGKMAGHIVLPWIHRVFALMKRWGLAPIMGCAASTSTRISTSLSSDTIGASTGTSRSKPCSGSPRTIVGRDNPRKGVPTVRREPRRRRTATGMRADRSTPPEKVEPSPVSDSTRQP